MLKFTRTRTPRAMPNFSGTLLAREFCLPARGVRSTLRPSALAIRATKFCSKREYAWRFRDEYSFPTGHEIYCVLHLYSTQLSYVTVAARD